MLAETSLPLVQPLMPATLGETRLSFELVTELVLKVLHRSAGMSGGELAKRVGLNFAIIEQSLDLLKAQRLAEIAGGASLGPATFRYRLTGTGHKQALDAFEQCQYCGVAPVPISEYQEYTDEFRRSVPTLVTAEQVREAFSHLVVSPRVLDEIGPAVNSRHSIFIYGPPGNGKTVMSRAIRSLLGGTIAIPHAIEVSGAIIRFFDPTVHEPVESDHDTVEGWDRRWVICRRPMVTVGGELTLDTLGLAFNPRSGVYRAPVQALANGGVLLIDEFGRQRCQPRDLLNWWMVPLESGVEALSLQSGEKLEMPFFPLVIFATNLRPSELVDEAFLRRIQYKIFVGDPTADDYIRIFERTCEERMIPFDRDLVGNLLERVYGPRGLQLRACQPRDLINQALSLASYRGEPRRLTTELLDEACASYFIAETEKRPGGHTGL
jgi:predicted ATPase with chaperone activity